MGENGLASVPVVGGVATWMKRRTESDLARSSKDVGAALAAIEKGFQPLVGATLVATGLMAGMNA